MAVIRDISSLCRLGALVSSLFFMPAHVNAVDSSRISLTGTVVSGEIADDGSGSVKITLRLRLVFKNIGSKPALLLRQQLEIVERTLRDKESPAGDCLLSLASYPSIDRSREWKDLRKRVNKRWVPSDVIRTLVPDETWTTEITDWFYIGKETAIDSSSKPWKVIREASPVWLQVTFELWPKNIEPRPEREDRSFGKMLQHRWRRAGVLQLENLTSDPMRLDLSSFTVKSARQ